MNTIIALELRQRLKGAAWWVLLTVWIVVIAGVTALTWFATDATLADLQYGDDSNPWLFSLILGFVLLLAMLVTPALSGNSINGDRQDGVLATTQITSVSGAQLVWGKFFAAWITALVFLLTASPFLAVAALIGDVSWKYLAISLALVLLEMGVVCAIGVGLSGVMKRPLFSIVTTYLVVALFGVGTIIGTGLAAMLFPSKVQTTVTSIDWDRSVFPEQGKETLVCTTPQVETISYPRTDRFWWILAANPFVVVADATPMSFDASGNPNDLFSMVKYGVRELQITPDMPTVINDCTVSDQEDTGPTPREVISSTWPSWFVGAAVHVLVGLALMLRAVRLTRIPIRRLPKGQRIA